MLLMDHELSSMILLVCCQDNPISSNLDVAFAIYTTDIGPIVVQVQEEYKHYSGLTMKLICVPDLFTCKFNSYSYKIVNFDEIIGIESRIFVIGSYFVSVRNFRQFSEELLLLEFFHPKQ